MRGRFNQFIRQEVFFFPSFLSVSQWYSNAKGVGLSAVACSSSDTKSVISNSIALLCCGDCYNQLLRQRNIQQ